ncbi:MAG: prepilin-type N-terminal cleavage/methylation domain-containing protein [Planctomycetota bacterium]|nr:MAG: prepilin-type N-terminal cleavage/methylation domain-containing protein [Planctomycetota bacterium]
MDRKRGKCGFSLVELIIVIVIIGVLAAIAIPRVSQGSRGAGESALVANLAILRNALELYASEHDSVYPGKNGDGTNPAGADALVTQLTKYSNSSGAVVDVRDAAHPYGPYLRKGIPPLPLGANKGNGTVLIDNVNSPPNVSEGTGEGWVFNANTGDIIANTTATDDSGKAYSEY